MASEFRLGYAMLLSLLRMEGGDPEALMRSSFRQFQTQRALPALEAAAQARARALGLGVGFGWACVRHCRLAPLAPCRRRRRLLTPSEPSRKPYKPPKS